MQDSSCGSDINCTYRKLKISYECCDSFFSNFDFFELRHVFRTFNNSNSGYIFFRFFWIFVCLPPAPSNTGAYAFRAHMPSSRSVTWQSNGSDFSKSEHYYCVTWIFPNISHALETSSLILSLWEAVVSDFDRRVVLKKSNLIFEIFFEIMNSSRCTCKVRGGILMLIAIIEH